MPGGPYDFLGLSTLGYNDYRDEATGRMLVAEPGSAYAIAAIDGELTVPPPDGRWADTADLPGSATAEAEPSPPPRLIPPPRVPALTEGGDAA